MVKSLSLLSERDVNGVTVRSVIQHTDEQEVGAEESHDQRYSWGIGGVKITTWEVIN